MSVHQLDFGRGAVVRRVAFLFVGGAHQVYHAAPAAAEMARHWPEVAVTCLVASDDEQRAVERVLAVYGAKLTVERLHVPAWLRPLQAERPTLKLPLLWANRRRFDMFDAIVMPERTSTVLRRFGVRKPALIHIPHGAGDRARGFERRLARFDYVIAAGEKDARRMVEDGGLQPEQCGVSGYVKIDFLRRLGGARPRLFACDRPVVLYNPHFDAKLSSWRPDGERLIRAFAAQDQYNLIVAPHVRLFEKASAAERAQWEGLAVPGRIIIDLGSERSIDMSYTAAADIYIGDVSSQAYEFIAEPRPCLFVDANATAWRGDPNFAFWNFGEVMDAGGDIFTALARAVAGHAARLPIQRAAAAAAFGAEAGAAQRAAELITAYLAASRGEPFDWKRAAPEPAYASLAS